MKSKKQKKITPSVASDKKLTSFAKKLETWGSTLPANERPFVQFLTQRVREVKLVAIAPEKLQVALGTAVRTMFSTAHFKKRQGLEGWVEIGPIWLRSGPIPAGWVEIGPIWLRNG